MATLHMQTFWQSGLEVHATDVAECFPMLDHVLSGDEVDIAGVAGGVLQLHVEGLAGLAGEECVAEGAVV